MVVLLQAQINDKNYVCLFMFKCPGDQLRANRQCSVYVNSSSQDIALYAPDTMGLQPTHADI